MYKPNITPHEHLSKPPRHYARSHQAQRDRVILIRELIKNGTTQTEIARALGISRQAISQLLKKYPDHEIDYKHAFWASELDY